MFVELKLLNSLLKLTQNSSILIEDVKEDCRIPSDIVKKLLKNLQNQGLAYLDGDSVKTDSSNRLKLAIRAVSLGGDLEQVTSLLGWQEFEEIAAYTLKTNGYIVTSNLHFKHAGRKWELDLIGCKKPLVVCIDCKHYHHMISYSKMQKIVENQVQRTKALSDLLPGALKNFDFSSWSKAKFVPAILSLLPNPSKFYDSVPIVPVLQIQDFINQLPIHVESLRYYQREISHL